MESPLWMAMLITSVTALMVIVMALGLYKSAHMPNMTTQHHVVTIWMIGGLIAWLLIALMLGAGGFFVAGPTTRVPRIAYALVPLLIGYGLFWILPTFRQTVARMPRVWLIGVQFYRILGGVFLIGYAQGHLPAEFALPAGIGDILIGLLAPLVAAQIAAHPTSAHRYAVAWNIAGLADLVLAVTLGILSAPGPLQLLALDKPNTAISAYPFVLIPVVLVPLSILLHLFSLHGLAQVRSETAQSSVAAH